MLVGEEDSQLLLVPGNYRLHLGTESNLGALMMLSDPIEQDTLKLLALTVVKPL